MPLSEALTFPQVILATNIAESSVTIPKVGYVIDSCRSLQVFWDNNRKTDSVELVWVSKSQVLIEPCLSLPIPLHEIIASNVLRCRQTKGEGELVVLVMAMYIDW